MNTSKSVAVLVTTAALAASCGGQATPGGGVVAGATYTSTVTADPGVLDPATAILSVTNTVLGYAYDTLVAARPDGSLVPALAEKWDVKPDSVTFTLRKNVTCADGSPVTPSTVAANFTYITDPAGKSPLRGVLVPPDLTAKGDDAAGTVTLATPKPFSFILESARDVYIVCGKGLKDRSVLARQTSGSGLFQLTEAVSGDHYTFNLRQDYAWGPEGVTGKTPGLPVKVVLKVISNEQTAVNLLASGAVNSTVVTGSDRQRVEADPSITKLVVAMGNGQFFYHQGDGRPAKDPAVRKALTQAVNLQELAGIAGGGTGRKATSLVMEPRPCKGDSVTGHVPAYDPRAAAAALDAAGWKQGPDGIRQKDGKRLTLRYLFVTTKGAAIMAAAEYLAAEWKKAGVEVKLNGVIDTKLAESLNATQDWDVAWLPIGVALPSQLIGFLSGPAAPEGANFAHLDNARYTELVAKAGGRPAPASCADWEAAESALFEAADLVPVVENTAVVAVKGATVQAISYIVIPSSIRMTKAS
ncbi:ABC transporter substrate-binding protein [Nonomuraea africana]|uniref:Peptide/nickel transport system substrate-binding protein n=1 Tax=Nonomuraea africana TaxID=46171 RepID=A0ABR9KCJ5_9ACTN|nr:ABC transporter substrate-binding protein [Nonomuraea africana]MBE1559526.1 peptide/nickel transport system substrate-binding protein [Nonomuraea africana]